MNISGLNNPLLILEEKSWCKSDYTNGPLHSSTTASTKGKNVSLPSISRILSFSQQSRHDHHNLDTSQYHQKSLARYRPYSIPHVKTSLSLAINNYPYPSPVSASDSSPVSPASDDSGTVARSDQGPLPSDSQSNSSSPKYITTDSITLYRRDFAPDHQSIQQLANITASLTTSANSVYEDVSLSDGDINRLIATARSSKNPIKAKRDTAMLYLLLDLKLACQKIADLRYRDVAGIINGDFQGVYRYTKGSSIPSKAIKCQPRTAQGVRDWVNEVNGRFGWEYQSEAPLFVPLALYGDQKEPRRIPLKRDAISKVFSSIKSHCGVQMTKEMINRTSF